MAKKRSAQISTLGSRATSVVSVTLVLILLGLAAFAGIMSYKVAGDIRSNIGFIVKMERGAADDDVNALKRTLGKAPYVESYVFASADDIMAEESRYLGDDIAGLIDENPFGAEFDVKVRPAWADADSIARLAAGIQASPSVDTVLTQSDFVHNVNTTLRRITVIMLAIAAVLLLISFVLINNTVSLSIYSRRFVIHTMKLVGATRAFIRRPFVVAGAVSGIMAAAIASGVLAAIRAYAPIFDIAVEQTISWVDCAAVFVVLFVIGVAICSLASLVATNRYLRAGYDDIYMK